MEQSRNNLWNKGKRCEVNAFRMYRNGTHKAGTFLSHIHLGCNRELTSVVSDSAWREICVDLAVN